MNTRTTRLLQWCRRRPRPFPVLTLLLLLLLVAGCDAVQWEGFQVGVHRPEAPGREAAEAEAVEPVTPAAPVLPVGPVLFHVRRLDPAGRARIEAVAELGDRSLQALGPRRTDRTADYARSFTERYYVAGREYTLARAGARVGTFIVSAPLESGSGACLRLRAEGRVELWPAADTMSEFLGWSREVVVPTDTLATPRSRADMLELSGILADRLVRERGPAGRWRIRSPGYLRAVRVGQGELGFTATFVVGDSLATGPPPDSAGMVFLVADHSRATGYFPLYFDAVWYGPGGKRVLRWIDRAELLPAEGLEWVVRGHGDAATWYEVIGREEGERRVIWSGRDPVCEARATATAAAPE